MKLDIKYMFPTNAEFLELFNSVGWDREITKIEQHRKSTTFCVCVYDENFIVGMASVVGDGSYYTVYDVITRKNYQGKGIGKLLMTEIIKWYKSIEDDDTYLYLGACENKEKFYEKQFMGNLEQK